MRPRRYSARISAWSLIVELEFTHSELDEGLCIPKTLHSILVLGDDFTSGEYIPVGDRVVIRVPGVDTCNGCDVPIPLFLRWER